MAPLVRKNRRRLLRDRQSATIAGCTRTYSRELADGINFVVVAMGVFGIGEIVGNLEHELTREVTLKKVTGLMPSKEDFKRIVGPILRGTGLGAVLGILPGGGAMLASFSAYALEIAKPLVPFGKGAIEGVAAPEAANNAGAQTSFIPMLTLGIPSNPVMALMIGAMIIQGIQPGPSVMTEQPALFWGIVVSMWASWATSSESWTRSRCRCCWDSFSGR